MLDGWRCSYVATSNDPTHVVSFKPCQSAQTKDLARVRNASVTHPCRVLNTDMKAKLCNVKELYTDVDHVKKKILRGYWHVTKLFGSEQLSNFIDQFCNLRIKKVSIQMFFSWLGSRFQNLGTYLSYIDPSTFLPNPSV